MGSRRITWARYGYLVLMGIVTVCVLLQVYIAGMAVFVDPSNWELHMVFVHLFEPLLLPLLACGFLGKLPRALKLAPVGLFLLLAFQYATASQYGSLVAAIHPVNAIVIVFVAAHSFHRTWSIVSEPPGEAT